MVWAVLNEGQNAALKELIDGQKSDRIVAIIGGAMLDDSLRRALELRFRPQDGNTDMNEKLFRVTGPMGNLGPKIDLGYQLYMLDKSARNSMHGMAEIRNLFAHNLTITFDDAGEKMTKAVAKLIFHEGKTHYTLPNGDLSEHAIEATGTTREKYFVNLKLALMYLMGDNRLHRPWSNIPSGLAW